MLIRAQEMARYVCDGVLDAGLTGQAWIAHAAPAVREQLICGLLTQAALCREHAQAVDALLGGADPLLPLAVREEQCVNHIRAPLDSLDRPTFIAANHEQTGDRSSGAPAKPKPAPRDIGSGTPCTSFSSRWVPNTPRSSSSSWKERATALVSTCSEQRRRGSDYDPTRTPWRRAGEPVRIGWLWVPVRKQRSRRPS